MNKIDMVFGMCAGMAAYRFAWLKLVYAGITTERGRSTKLGAKLIAAYFGLQAWELVKDKTGEIRRKIVKFLEDVEV